jgi:hypothetical protein
LKERFFVTIYASHEMEPEAGIIGSEDLDIYTINCVDKESALDLFGLILKFLRVERPKNESSSNINNNRTI